jgi:hypothetical protein
MNEKWRVGKKRKSGYDRAHWDLPKSEADRITKEFRAKKLKIRLRKDPNGRYEIWVKGKH